MDEDSVRSVPLSPLSPLPEDEGAPRTDPDIQNFNAAIISPPTTSRRRRLLNRLTRFGEPATPDSPSSSSRSLPNFNPQAAEFVPSAKMPPKRKASSFMRSGKSSQPALRTSSVPADQPSINSEDLFGADGPSTSSAASTRGIFEGMLDDTDDENSSDIFELEMQDLHAGQDQNRPVQRRERLHDALAVMRHRTNEKVRLAAPPPQSKSALLFTYDRPASPGADESRIRYLPLCPSSNSGRRDAISKETHLTVLPSAQQQIDDAMSISTASQAQWPTNQLPVEIFELIIEYLSRDDVKSMRLVTKEFEEKVSRSLFNTSVVPFNTELYDMIDEDARAFTRGSRVLPGPEGKGKGRARDGPDAIADLRSRLQWQNAKDDAEGKVYRGHGLRVFQGFGPHIKRFGMSFEVAEGQLCRPPIKKELDHLESYYGSYDWPTQQYTRFANLAGLERTADETLRMKAAFSNLENVRDLGLSVDSGLGWLNGPDKSMRAQIFERPSSIFGDSREIPDRQIQEAQDFWNTVQSCHRGLGMTNSPKEVLLAHKHLNKSPAELRGLQGSRYADSRRWPSIAANRAILAPANSQDIQSGVLYTTCDLSSSALFDKSALMPADLRKEQKEWLLETEWAQRAFLECYMLAVIDNPVVFGNVKTLNIAKLSSGFLPLLANEPFWDALPGVTDVTLLVKPDWRTVERDNAGFAETSNQNPSEAVKAFNSFIARDRLCLRPSIATLTIGWAAGGEQAEGIFARNANLLPAPITQLEHSTAAATQPSTVFKFVEHLTLTNCWLTPPTLVELVRSHAGTQLKKFTLDSVSLTAHPRFPAGGQQQQIAQALAALHPGAFPPVGPQQNQNNNQANLQAQVQMMNPQNQMNPAFVQPQVLQAAWQVPPQFMNGFNAPQAAAPAGQWALQFPINGAAAPVFNPPGFAPMPAPQQVAPAAGQFNNIVLPPIPPAPQAPSHWTASHREGSWPEILDSISPGASFNDYLPQPAPWEDQFPERPTTNLETLELKSCGYAKLGNNSTFDQFAVEANFEHHLSNWFRTRQLALSAAMMTSSDRFMARIVQHIPQRELDAMLFAWGLTEGWEDRVKAEEAEYDGLLPGGTGRVSGRIYRGMALLAQRETREL